MDRRTFLSSVVLGGATAYSATFQPVRAASTYPTFLLIDGITLKSSPGGLFAFLDPIISQNVPVCLAVNADHDDLPDVDPNSDLANLLRLLVTDYPGLVEVALNIPELASLHAYHRIRAVSEAAHNLRKVLSAGDVSKAKIGGPQTVVMRHPDKQVPTIEGLRAANVLHSLLVPDAASKVEIWQNADGTHQINGGRRLPAFPTSQDIEQALSKAIAPNGAMVLAVSFPGEALKTEDELFNQGAILGDGFRQHIIASRNYLMLPSELRFRSGEVLPRHLVLCLKGTPSSDTLGQTLVAAGIPFTEIGERFKTADDITASDSSEDVPQLPHQCLLVSAQEDAWIRTRQNTFGKIEPDTLGEIQDDACAAINGDALPLVEQGHQAGFNAILNLSDIGPRFSGFDGQGALHMNVSLALSPQTGPAAVSLREQIIKNASSAQDVVLLIDRDAYSNTDAASSLVNELVELGNSKEFNLIDMSQFIEAVSVKSAEVRLTRAAKRWPARSDAEGVSQVERDQLIDDAKVAWSYFENNTNPDTGLTHATSWRANETFQAYKFSTMWDTGSQILAILSAHSIGIIEDTEFTERANAVLAGLQTSTFKGLKLPKGKASTNLKATGDDKYDASDTARLLTALHLLGTYSKTDLGITQIVEGWDLNETIRDGIPMTARGSRFGSSYRSNYAAYIARAFALWGFPVEAPYSEPLWGSAFDHSVHYLQDAGKFGPIGTEPHLLEEVELGISKYARAASDALFAAQIEKYLSTGNLTCVSEGPINRAPWFVYQGFQIDKTGGRWTFETLDPRPRFKTKGFRRAVDVLNSKAAFLWHVYRPCDYTDLLVEKVREKAKIRSLGFSPGVFSVTGTSDQAYSDINTNGVILQAIAYRLNGSKPVSAWGTDT